MDAGEGVADGQSREHEAPGDGSEQKRRSECTNGDDHANRLGNGGVERSAQECRIDGGRDHPGTQAGNGDADDKRGAHPQLCSQDRHQIHGWQCRWRFTLLVKQGLLPASWLAIVPRTVYRYPAVGLFIFLVCVAAIDARATYGARLSVDEPHYLLTAISLGEDFDLDVSDELAELRYRPFHEQISINEQTVPLNDAGQRLSPHDPLLPLILAGPMKIGGWVAARITMALIAAATGLVTLALAERRLGIDANRAALVVAALFATPPLVAFGNQVYPAMPSALCVAVGLLAVTGDLRRWWPVAGIAIVALPWLSVKYVAHAAMLGLALLWGLRQEGRRALLSGAFLAVMGVIYLVVHQRIYGGWTVYAAGDHFVGGGEWEVVGSNFNPWGRTRRLIGLIVDRGFGLAAWAPVFLATPAALAWYGARRRPHWRLLIGMVLVGWFMATWVAVTMHGWWWPGRQLMPVLPVIVVVFAAAVERSRARLVALLLASLVSVVGWLWLVVEASTGRRTLVFDFRDTAYPWYRIWRRLLPDHQQLNLQDPVLTIIWAALLVGAAALVWMRATATRRASAPDPMAPGESRLRAPAVQES